MRLPRRSQQPFSAEEPLYSVSEGGAAETSDPREGFGSDPISRTSLPPRAMSP
jgi:hypothetical protein